MKNCLMCFALKFSYMVTLTLWLTYMYMYNETNAPYIQLFHPFATEGYRETIRAMRKIGLDCITRRFKAIANKEEVPNDILTQIVRVASSDACGDIDLEDLVDDFVTFYVAGELQ